MPLSQDLLNAQTQLVPTDQVQNRSLPDDHIEIFGAREHNLKNIDISFPRNQLIVITGISGSGKSSLAFDTLYAEGQRRYMESFSAYARSFIGTLERPDVDKINGLSPVIAIEQKTTSRNPRSTVGTVTEIYDFLRLLYARAAEAYSYVTGEKMIKQSEDQIIEQLFQHYKGKKLTLLAPYIKGRKGHYREDFIKIRKAGYAKVRVDGEMMELIPKMQLDRYKTHDIEIVIDRLVVKEEDRFRISQSVKTALKEGNGIVMCLDESENVRHFSKFLMCPTSGIAYEEPAPNSFSFNSPYGYCPTCLGLGHIEEITEDSIIPDKNLSVIGGAIVPLGEYRDIWIFKKIEQILKKYKASLSTPINKLSPEAIQEILFGSSELIEVESVKYPGTTWATQFEGIINFLKKQQDYASEEMQEWVQNFAIIRECPDCQGQRLKKESLHFKIDNLNIAQVSQMNLRKMGNWLAHLEDRMLERQRLIGSEVLKEIRKRLGFLLDVGLDYLELNRAFRTLSGGEAQRIRLATQIGTQLVGVLYILDEPSIGLHQRDNEKLIKALKNLRDIGNSVVVVEHDKDMMLEADCVIDIGPGAGRHGGRVVAMGTPEEFIRQNSLTAQYLMGTVKIPLPTEYRKGTGKFLELKGAKGHNLKNVSLKLPLGQMICISGVSGSGKSSLIHHTLFPILNKHFYRGKREPLVFEQILGLEYLDKVIEVDQSPIGRTPRSNPATYTGVFSDIRTLFTELPESKIRGYKAGRFSFNVKGPMCWSIAKPAKANATTEKPSKCVSKANRLPMCWT
jgi:excinuclease ABC subunit A